MRIEYKAVEWNATRGTTEEIFVKDTRGLAQWLAQWVEAAKTCDSTLEIEFIPFGDVTADLAGTMRRVFGEHFDAAAEKRTEDFLAQHHRGRIDRRNFRRGTSGEWRDRYSREALDQAWEAIPTTVRDLLRLER